MPSAAGVGSEHLLNAHVTRVHKCPPSCKPPASVSAEFRLTVAVMEPVAIFAPSESEIYRHKLTWPREFVGLSTRNGVGKRGVWELLSHAEQGFGVLFFRLRCQLLVLVGFERV